MNGAYVGELPARDSLTDTDRWILDRLEQVRTEVDLPPWQGFEFSKANEALYHFAWDEFCDWYVEMSKVDFPRLAEGETLTPHRSSGLIPLAAFWVGSRTLLRLLHPTMPFVTETLWLALVDDTQAQRRLGGGRLARCHHDY